jgi:hypothetical protein
MKTDTVNETIWLRLALLGALQTQGAGFHRCWPEPLRTSIEHEKTDCKISGHLRGLWQAD